MQRAYYVHNDNRITEIRWLIVRIETNPTAVYER